MSTHSTTDNQPKEAEQFWFSESSAAGITYIMIFNVKTSEIRRSKVFKPFAKKIDAYNECVRLNFHLGWKAEEFHGVITLLQKKIDSML